MKILLVEDDPALNKQIVEYLTSNSYIIDSSYDGEEAEIFLKTSEYDLIILDLGLPKIDGVELLKIARQNKKSKKTPILILTARSEWHSKVQSLNLGADDYLVKPFNYEELLARVKALIRRSVGLSLPVLTTGKVKLDTITKAVTLNDKPVSLTKNELVILEYLLTHKSSIISKSKLEDQIYNTDANFSSNTMEVFIKRLRAKLGKTIIKTHRGLGYQIE